MLLSGGQGRTQETVTPVNDGPNPYRTIRNWGTLPAGREWGATSGIDIDRDGRSVWVAERCGTSCVGSKLDPVLKFDESGKLVRSFGAGMFAWPHSVHVDQDGNVWVVDARRTTPDEQKKFPGEPIKGNIVVKFSPEGKVLLTLGKSGVAGSPPEAFTDPNDVVTAPNGDIYVSESHTTWNPRRTRWRGSRCSIGMASSSGRSANWGPGRANSGRRMRWSSTRAVA